MSIKLENVNVNFGEKEILNDFSYEFKDEKITVIEGESGSGKTTILKLLAGIRKCDDGTISGLEGKKLSFAFQENRLCEDFSVLSNVSMVLPKSIIDKESLVRKHLEKLSMDGDIKTPVKNLSGGMKRRVALARAIAYNGDVILLDEPFNGLDDELKIKAMDYIKDYTKGKTVIIVSHDKSVSEYMADTVLKL